MHLFACLSAKKGGGMPATPVCLLSACKFADIFADREREIYIGGVCVKEMTEERRRRNQQIEKGEDREKEREERRKR